MAVAWGVFVYCLSASQFCGSGFESGLCSFCVEFTCFLLYQRHLLSTIYFPIRHNLCINVFADSIFLCPLKWNLRLSYNYVPCTPV